MIATTGARATLSVALAPETVNFVSESIPHQTNLPVGNGRPPASPPGPSRGATPKPLRRRGALDAPDSPDPRRRHRHRGHPGRPRGAGHGGPPPRNRAQLHRIRLVL